MVDLVDVLGLVNSFPPSTEPPLFLGVSSIVIHSIFALGLEGGCLIGGVSSIVIHSIFVWGLEGGCLIGVLFDMIIVVVGCGVVWIAARNE